MRRHWPPPTPSHGRDGLSHRLVQPTAAFLTALERPALAPHIPRSATRGRREVSAEARLASDPASPELLLRDGVELVADPVARLDERVPRRAAVDLLAHLADEDVDGAVAVGLAPAPDALEELVAGHDAASLERERVEEPELGRRQAWALALDVRLHRARADAELLAPARP